MRLLILACVAWLLLGACQRTPPPAFTASKPSCDRKLFEAAVESFDTLARRRDEVIARVEALPLEEPAQYVVNLEEDLKGVRALAAQAQAVTVPKCLLNARGIYVRAFEQTLAALDARRPTEAGGFDAYEQAREGANATLQVFGTEVKQQARNVE